MQDNDSLTHDNLRGVSPQEGFQWRDRFNRRHFLKLAVGDQWTCFFPSQPNNIFFTAKDINKHMFDTGSSLRVGCTAAHRWCQAQFVNEGHKIRSTCVFYFDTDFAEKCTDWSNFKKIVSEIAEGADKGLDLAGKATDVLAKIKAL